MTVVAQTSYFVSASYFDRKPIALEGGGNPLVSNRESTADVAECSYHSFEWLPWSYWRYEVGRCHAAKELQPIWSFLLNSRLESFHLLNIEFRVD